MRRWVNFFTIKKPKIQIVKKQPVKEEPLKPVPIEKSVETPKPEIIKSKDVSKFAEKPRITNFSDFKKKITFYDPIAEKEKELREATQQYQNERQMARNVRVAQAIDYIKYRLLGAGFDEEFIQHEVLEVLSERALLDLAKDLETEVPEKEEDEDIYSPDEDDEEVNEGPTYEKYPVPDNWKGKVSNEWWAIRCVLDDYEVMG